MSRLIDADALLAGYKNMGYDPAEHPEESYMEGWCKGFNAAVDHCMHHVIHAQTIEPERKKGKWIDETLKPWGLVYHPYRCDQCGDHSEADSNFCPNCGARMEETDERT